MLTILALRALVVLVAIPGLPNIPGIGKLHWPKHHKAAVRDTIPPHWKPQSRLVLEDQFVHRTLAPLTAHRVGLKVQFDPRQYYVTVNPDSGTITSGTRLGQIPLGPSATGSLAQYAHEIPLQTFEEVWRQTSILKLNTMAGHSSGQGQGFPGARPAGAGLSFQLPSPLPQKIQNLLGPGGPSLNVSGSENISLSGTSSWSNQQIGLIGQHRSLFPSLDMQQNLDIRLEGQLSDRIKVNLLQNSANQIPLANRIAINYKGSEDDLIQEFDLGNTNLSLPGTQYVSYSGRNEGLFGVKSTLRYGPLDLTALASKQEGRSERASYAGAASRQTPTIADLEYIQGVYYLLYDPNGRPRVIDEGSLKVYKDDYSYGNLANKTLGRALLEPARTTETPGDTNFVDTTSVRGSYKLLERGADKDFDLLNDLRDDPHKYLRLHSPLSGDQKLAVTYDFRYVDSPDSLHHEGGQDVAVGDTTGAPTERWMKLLRSPASLLTRDPVNQDVFDTNTVVVLPGNFRPRAPLNATRELEMRNFYNLGGTNIDPRTFTLRIRKGFEDPPRLNFIDPSVGIPLPYIELLGLDSRQQADSLSVAIVGHDGKVDQSPINPHIRAIIDYTNGTLMFPDLHPFAPRLDRQRWPFEASIDTSAFVQRRAHLNGGSGSDNEPNRAVYESYTVLHNQAEYFMDVEYTAQRATGEIYLGRSNIVEGSETVTINGLALLRDKDYTIDYDLGKVRLIRQLGPADNHTNMQPIFQRVFLVGLIAVLVSPGFAQRSRARQPRAGSDILLQIIRAEDRRELDESLKLALNHVDPKIRMRAALAAGRIGQDGAIPLLADMLLTDRDNEVRDMAAFALGEIESAGAAYALVTVVEAPSRPGRARSVEALGKIVAAMMANQALMTASEKEADAERLDRLKATIVGALRFESKRRSQADEKTILLGLTAVLRAQPDGVGPLLKEFLDYRNARIVADALNTLARLRLRNGNDDARRLLKHADPIVRANAARVLGATEDKEAFDALLDRALHDADERVSVSAIRALGSLKDARAAGPLIERGHYLLKLLKGSGRLPIEPRNELLELATSLGRVIPTSENKDAFDLLTQMGEEFAHQAPEIEIAAARIAPEDFLRKLGSGREARTNVQRTMLLNWRAAASLAQALGEIIGLLPADAKDQASRTKVAADLLRAMLDYRNSGLTINTLVAVHSEYAVPDVLRALAKAKPNDLAELLRGQLSESDVIVRATAADLISELPSDAINERALIAALPKALADKNLNDAALSILDSLAKQKTSRANEAIKSTLNSTDYLVRKRAADALKASGAGDFSGRIGNVQTRNTDLDYRRALARIGKRPTATVTTTKGSFTIEFVPEDAPLTVDNFIQLARRQYFNGQQIPRVVPNFVIQAGDPRGDQNGGPGYQIRCEINEVPFDRAAVGMALSGKDTGGSQWFVTHSPQPHLDGGYTVFGRVIAGMDVVDRIARGDVIRSVTVNER